MDYSEIQIKILIALSKLNSIVSVDPHDYTHQPCNSTIVDEIDRLQEELNKIKNQISK